MKKPYTKFGKTLDVKLETWTNNKEDKPPKEKWDVVLWIESAEDEYALIAYARQGKVTRVVRREYWLRAVDADARR